MSMQAANEIVDELADRGFAIDEALKTLKEAEDIIRIARAGKYMKVGEIALGTITQELKSGQKIIHPTEEEFASFMNEYLESQKRLKF